MTQVLAPLMELDPAVVEQNFGRRSFPLRHRLHEHPLTQLDALAALADSLPPEVVEHNLGSVDALVPGGEVPRAELTAGEIVRTIETNGCWMVMPIQDAPAYRELYGELLETVTSVRPGAEPAKGRHQGVFILSAPNSTTPTHLDLEQGYLLQLVGNKHLSIGEFSDAAAASREVERFLEGGHRNLADLPANAETYELNPGEGVHVPALVPHFVNSGPEVSISFNVGFVTEAISRRERVHRANGYLRRVGITPSAVGEHPARDRAKERLIATAGRTVRAVRRRR